MSIPSDISTCTHKSTEAQPYSDAVSEFKSRNKDPLLVCVKTTNSKLGSSHWYDFMAPEEGSLDEGQLLRIESETNDTTSRSRTRHSADFLINMDCSLEDFSRVYVRYVRRRSLWIEMIANV